MQTALVEDEARGGGSHGGVHEGQTAWGEGGRRRFGITNTKHESCRRLSGVRERTYPMWWSSEKRPDFPNLQRRYDGRSTQRGFKRL